MATPLSILDLALVGSEQSTGDALRATVALAQTAERCGYQRVWYAEHHNMSAIASSATSVLIAHVAAHTNTIKLGSGGIMLPNHAPLQIAEQFGTLAELHPGRIELGVGRAPGTDQKTLRALRTAPNASDHFPADVAELQAFLSDTSPIDGVVAVPGQGTFVPVYILGSSLFGARLAAAMGLPYAFASHFAPQHLHHALTAYRTEFRPSAQLAEPYAIAAANVICADDEATAQQLHLTARRRRASRFLRRVPRLPDSEADALLNSPAGRQVNAMMHYTAVGTAGVVVDWLRDFSSDTGVDEIITMHAAPDPAARVRSVELTPSEV